MGMNAPGPWYIVFCSVPLAHCPEHDVPWVNNHIRCREFDVHCNVDDPPCYSPGSVQHTDYRLYTVYRRLIPHAYPRFVLFKDVDQLSTPLLDFHWILVYYALPGIFQFLCCRFFLLFPYPGNS